MEGLGDGRRQGGLPDAPALAVRAGAIALVFSDGTVESPSPTQAIQGLEGAPVVVAHAGFLARRLGRNRPARRNTLFDVMELFAFVRPARPCLPTARGLGEAIGATAPGSVEDEAVILLQAVRTLLNDLKGLEPKAAARLADLAASMAKGGWAWSGPVLEALGTAPEGGVFGGLDAWSKMPEWQERAPQGQPSSKPIETADALTRLEALLGPGRSIRPGQDLYVETATAAFAPRTDKDSPRAVIAEAGTGIGKTLGYLAPASHWAEENGPGTWISTYTKNLQRQLDQEMQSVYPDPAERRRRAVVRKGRENYLCLLNFEEAVRRARGGVDDVVTLGLVARWLEHSRDGDMVGGDFPAWLMSTAEIQGGAQGPGLTDRRGECLYSACTHYRKCTIEKAVRRSRHAHLVIANHALVMTQSALDHALAQIRGPGTEDSGTSEHRVRVVFDESHHLFDAADSAFGATLSAQEAAELRRWLRGPESRGGRRGRGLSERIGDLLEADGDTRAQLQACLEAAHALPREGWTARQGGETAQGPAERFFLALRRHVEARAERPDSGDFGLEAACDAPHPELLANAGALADALKDLGAPLLALSQSLRQRLEDEAEDLDTPTRGRIDAVSRGLDRRGALMIPAWRAMLASLARGGGEPGMVDWFALERIGGRVIDAAMHRRHLDPMKPFTDGVAKPLHGLLMTSASLRDGAPPQDSEGETQDDDAPTDPPTDDWAFAALRTGARHLPAPGLVTRAIPSPFDYAGRTRVLIVRDLAARSTEQLAGAYRALFDASGGGALGLFTAISRLRAVHGRIAGSLEASGLPLYAQHMDAIDVGTLIDIFRDETDACLLGTDAVRDGVDVPGESLRLIVFDRVPWPRPDILHKARRAHFGARTYDDALARLRLKQAFGRLVRGPQDRGIFVLLDARTPSRLLTAFPDGVSVTRCGLAEAVAETRAFFGRPALEAVNAAR